MNKKYYALLSPTQALASIGGLLLHGQLLFHFRKNNSWSLPERISTIGEGRFGLRQDLWAPWIHFDAFPISTSKLIL